MSYDFRPAVREKTSLLLALAGPSGSGKTYSALKLATGLVGPKGRVAFIDTEAGRGLHYADSFRFEHCDMKPPFRPQTYREAIEAAEKAGFDAIVIDSMSHEYEGDGGLQDWAAELEAKGVKSPGNWKEPKTAHKRMMSRLLQCRAHLIFCLRAEEKIKIEKDPRTGKTVVVPAGWQPLCEKRFMYEMTASFMLLADAPGVPQPIKLQDQHRGAFQDGQKIGERCGEQLAAWAHGGKAPARQQGPATPEPSPLEEAEAIASQGVERFREWWNSPAGKAKRAALRDHIEQLQTIAKNADAAPEDDEDPFRMGDGQPADEKPAEQKVAQPADEPPALRTPAALYVCVDETGRELAGDGSPSSFVKALDGMLSFPGMALGNRQAVWRANHPTVQRVMALKDAELGAELERVQRFTMEKAA